MARSTPTRQRNTVSEGAALGLLMLGRDRIPNNKVIVDGSFALAFRAWALAGRFPQVGTDLRSLDGMRILVRADEAKHTSVLFWERSGKDVVIVLRDAFADDEKLDFEELATFIDREVPAEAWRQLAVEFLRRLDR